MAVIDNLKGLGNKLLLGHWGDVLFSRPIDIKNMKYDQQLIYLKNKIIKPGGIELAELLWKYWGFYGSFDEYFTDRLDSLYSNIKIDEPSSKMRAFKSLYWAPRWTSTNLSFFLQVSDLVLPYYDDEMCEYICSISEQHLSSRKIQIEYIKKYSSDLAKIPWQKYYPLNLNNYKLYNNPLYFPIRAAKKTSRLLQKYLFNNSDYIIRNWELQFIGKNNYTQLQSNINKMVNLDKVIPKEVISNQLEYFKINPIKYSHPISMLLTLSFFSQFHYKK